MVFALFIYETFCQILSFVGSCCYEKDQQSSASEHEQIKRLFAISTFDVFVFPHEINSQTLIQILKKVSFQPKLMPKLWYLSALFMK